MTSRHIATLTGKKKLIDRFAAVALVGCLRYLTLHFKIQPVEFGKIKSGLRNRTNSKGAEKCSTFNENIIEALYDIQVNFIDMESDVYLANEIRRLYQVIFSEDIDAESLLTPKSVDTFVLQIKKSKSTGNIRSRISSKAMVAKCVSQRRGGALTHILQAVHGS